MTKIILRELSSSDIDWMASVGRKLKLWKAIASSRLVKIQEALYLILEGELALVLPHSNHSVKRVVSYSSGDVMGLFFYRVISRCLWLSKFWRILGYWRSLDRI